MDLPENVGVELVQEVFEWCADIGFHIFGDYPRVLGIGLQEEDVVEMDQTDLFANGRFEPFAWRWPVRYLQAFKCFNKRIASVLDWSESA